MKINSFTGLNICILKFWIVHTSLEFSNINSKFSKISMNPVGFETLEITSENILVVDATSNFLMLN